MINGNKNNTSSNFGTGDRQKLKIFVACEESQEVCKAFRELGHEAYSCDIEPCSGGHPEWHIQDDALLYINGSGGTINDLQSLFMTQDGNLHEVPEKWDMIIAFPPCTYLTVTGNRWFNIEKYGDKAIQRQKDRKIAVEFFMKFANANCDKIAIENPIGIMSSYFRKPDQIIHPYYFASEDGDENCERKSTCLWLKGVQPLEYEIKYSPRVIKYKNGKGTDSAWHMNTINLPQKDRAKMRSKTYPGVAKAMAEQWGAILTSG